MKYVTPRSFLNKRLNILEKRARRTRLFSRPVCLHVEPTLQCNSFCVMCNRSAVRKGEDRGAGFLSWETLYALGPFFPWAEQVLFGGFGEPLLHPEYVSMLGHIKGLGPEIYFITNGILLAPDTSEALVEAGVDRIYVSFGGARPETYRKVRGVDMEPIVENLRALKGIKGRRGARRPRIIFNIVAMNSMLEELEEVVALAASLGVEEIDLPHLSVQKPELEEESPWLDPERARPMLERATRCAREEGIELHLPEFVPKKLRCTQLFDSLTITWDGKVLSCPMERHLLGDLACESAQSVWNRPELVALRRRALEEGCEGICPNCFCCDSRAETFLHPHENSRRFAADIRAPGPGAGTGGPGTGSAP